MLSFIRFVMATVSLHSNRPLTKIHINQNTVSSCVSQYDYQDGDLLFMYLPELGFQVH